jgi:hypothetical protein
MKEVKRALVRSQSLASRIAGFSFLGVGMSWKAPEPERVVVRDVITSLEDKRALYGSSIRESPDHVTQSILKIRDELTAGIKRVGDNSPAKQSFAVMRKACRDFLNRPGGNESGRDWGHWQQEEFLIGLGKLRGVFGSELETLAYLYGVDIEPDLATILPPQPDPNEKD